MPDKIAAGAVRPARPIKTYEVKVHGFPPMLYSARHPAYARVSAFYAYGSCDDSKSFRDFLKMSSIRRVPDPPGVGDRIKVGGREATRVIGWSGGHYVAFMRDDSNVVLYAHPSDVVEIDHVRGGTGPAGAA